MMSRKDDVNKLVCAAEDQYNTIRKEYKRALSDKSLDLRVPVKNLMENLRSALDYMAHGIYETYCQAEIISAGRKEPSNIYFPYGLTEEDFKLGVERSFLNLTKYSPEVYILLESIQPFKCRNSWLYDMCSIINEKKHDRLTPQVRKETETYTVRSSQGSVTIPINDPNVKITTKPGAVKIFDVSAQFTDKGIKTAPSECLQHERHKWIEFVFEGTSVNVIGLIDFALPGIATFSKNLYQLIYEVF